jgi:hypothetical protein
VSSQLHEAGVRGVIHKAGEGLAQPAREMTRYHQRGRWRRLRRTSKISLENFTM